MHVTPHVKAYSKNKVIVDVATGKIKCGLVSPGKLYEYWKSPRILFLKKGTNPEVRTALYSITNMSNVNKEKHRKDPPFTNIINSTTGKYYSSRGFHLNGHTLGIHQCTDSEVRTTLYSIASSSTGKYYSIHVAFI